MPNPHYNAGARFERMIVNLLKEHLREDQYTIIRTAGSKSPVDVILIQHLGDTGPKRSFGIQCKTIKKKKTTMTDGEIKKLREEYFHN